MQCLPCCRLFSYSPPFLCIMLTALSCITRPARSGGWGMAISKREGWGLPQNVNEGGWWREGSNALWGRARMLYMQTNSSPVCLWGIHRAVKFTVLGSACVKQLRSRSLKCSTSVLGCAAGRGSMLCVMSLTWNEPCHTLPTCIWYYHPASAIHLHSYDFICQWQTHQMTKETPRDVWRISAPRAEPGNWSKRKVLLCSSVPE